MRRACMPVVPLMILLWCGTGYGNEQSGELQKRLEATEQATNDLRERLQALESVEGCVQPSEGEKWEQFFSDLDRHNGDQAL